MVMNNIFSYSCHKKFIKDWMKKEKISFRKLGVKMGIVSSSYLHGLTDINSPKIISVYTVNKLSKLMKLNKDEDSFFRMLIVTGQSNIMNKNQKSQIKDALKRYKDLLAKVSPKFPEFKDFWKLVPDRGAVGIMTRDEIEQWSKNVFTQSRL